jgi:hypothetical protein
MLTRYLDVNGVLRAVGDGEALLRYETKIYSTVFVGADYLTLENSSGDSQKVAFDRYGDIEVLWFNRDQDYERIGTLQEAADA